jgi:lipid II:glycine glycyltransferase (peptidoglycan interpeptide bridge formation enzyme)
MRYETICEEAAPDPAWDARVEAAPGGDLTQTTLWAASRQRLGFRAWRIIVTDADGALAGLCMVYAKRIAPGLWAGSVPRGPLVFADRPAAAASVLSEVVSAVRRRAIRFLVIQPPEGAKAVEDAMLAYGFRPGVPSVAPEATIRLDLHRSDEDLLRAMTSNRRRDIRNALRANFEVREENDVAVFHRLHAATAKRQGFDAVTLENLEAQWESLAPDAKCAMFIARHGGLPVAGIWLTKFAGTVTFKLAGWDAAIVAPANANEALHWAAIGWARRQGAHTYDFGGFDRRNAERLVAGEPPDDNFSRSPSFFKQRFGGELILLPCARFAFTNPLANFVFGFAARRIVTSSRFRRLANQIRNGRLSSPAQT